MGIKRIINPMSFQGVNKTKKYFEGWYFKFVDKEEKNIFSFIIGISLGKNDTDSHCFIQIFDGKSNKADYIRISADEFQYSDDDFHIRVKENVLSESGITLKNEEVSGRINFKNISKWPENILAPGAMGWMAYLTFLKCYQGVYAMDLQLQGKMNIKGVEIDFTGGRGYIEKTWGREFPKDYFWMQCNHFDTEKTSFVFAVAGVPVLNKIYKGFICGFLHNGRFYRFATYTGARVVKLERKDDKIFFAIHKEHYFIEGTATLSEGTNLPSPIDGEMVGTILESMISKIYLKFYKDGKVLFEGEGRNLAVDTSGDITLFK